MSNSLYYDNGRQGWVYVLSNPSMPGLHKVGATRKHPLQRAKELGAGTGVPTPFCIEYYRDYQDSFLAESLVHQAFAAQRVDESREFFQVPLNEIIGYLEGLTTSAEYKDELISHGITGGDHNSDGIPVLTEEKRQVQIRRAYRGCRTPMAELFASFPDNGSPRELTVDEQAQCAALRRR